MFDTLLKVLATPALVALNAFFVAAEFSAVSARTSRLKEKFGKSKTINARAALFIKYRLDLFLSSCQFGNTLASLALGAVTEPAVATLISPVTAGMHLSLGEQRIVAFIISFAIAVGLHIVIGEQTPKNIAIQKSDAVLGIVGIPLVLFTYAFYPAIWALNAATHLVLRTLGASSGAGALAGHIPHSAEELHALLLQASATGEISKGKANLLANAFEFGGLKVRQIMTPRPEVDYLTLLQPIGEILRTVKASAFTRLPLCDGDLDHVVGQIHMKDLFNDLNLVPGKLKFLDERKPEGEAIAVAAGMPGSAVHVIGAGELDLKKIRRDVLFVPELMPLPTLLRLFQTRHLHLAIVVDEYGITQGIVTLEDVLEEIVGQIEDEFDPVAPTDLVRDGQAIRVSGLYALHDLNDRLAIGPIEAEGVDTIGGYIVQKLNRWPRVGDTVPLGEWRAKVLTLQQRRVGQVLIERETREENVGKPERVG